jgi:hypothetical protein
MKGAFQGAQMEKPIAEALSKTAHGLRGEIEGIADNAVDDLGAPLVARNGMNYSENMAMVAERVRNIAKLKEITKLGDTDPINSKQRLETYLAGAFGDRKSSSLAGLRQIEKMSGIKIVEPARRAMLNISFGDEGAAEVMPHLTPGMIFIGAPAAAGLGAAVGGIKGAIAGPALAAVAASPRNILRVTKGVLAVSDRAAQVQAAISSKMPRSPIDEATMNKLRQAFITQAARETGPEQ